MSALTASDRAEGGLAAAMERNPRGAFWAFALVHAVLWTLVPTLLCRSLPLDVTEAVAYGRDWQIGYWKHPPLPWILADVTHQLVGGQPWAFFLLGQLAAVTAFWAIWRLGREVLSPLQAFVAVVLLDGCIVFNITAMEFNHNIVQLPLFALAGWFLYRALVGAAWRDWLLVGLWFALAFYAKYEAVVLLGPAVAFTLIDPQARRCWRTPGPYLAAAVCTVLFAPHVIWLAVDDHFGALQFANGRARPMHSLFSVLLGNADFAVNGLLYIVPVLILFRIMAGRGIWTRKPMPDQTSDRFARRYLAFLAFGPLAVSLIAGLLLRRAFLSGWTMQFWVFISLYLMAVWRPVPDRAALRRLAIGWSGLTAIFVVVQIAAQTFLVASPSLYETQFPGARFSDLVTRAWHKAVGPQPLPYIVGEFWSAGNVILFSPERPRQFQEGDLTKSPRIDPADVRRRGAVILFPARAALNTPPPAAATAPWLAEFPGAQSQAPFVIRQKTPRAEIDWTIGWALLRPEKLSVERLNATREPLISSSAGRGSTGRGGSP